MLSGRLSPLQLFSEPGASIPHQHMSDEVHHFSEITCIDHCPRQHLGLLEEDLSGCLEISGLWAVLSNSVDQLLFTVDHQLAVDVFNMNMNGVWGSAHGLSDLALGLASLQLIQDEPLGFAELIQKFFGGPFWRVAGVWPGVCSGGLVWEGLLAGLDGVMGDGRHEVLEHPEVAAVKWGVVVTAEEDDRAVASFLDVKTKAHGIGHAAQGIKWSQTRLEGGLAFQVFGGQVSHPFTNRQSV